MNDVASSNPDDDLCGDLVGHALQHCSAYRFVHGPVREVGKSRRDPFKRLFAAQVRKRNRECKGVTLPP